jgi:epoxyqueuosine reductase
VSSARAATEAAFAAGATAVAIASAEPDLTTRERLRAAFARGDFATWPYDEDRAVAATDPATILPGARSVVCIALAFAHPAPRGRAPLTGRVSNYAWAADYHARMRAILRAVVRVLDESAGAPVARYAVDTAPIAERAFAARAGLGWIGKHTMAIVPGSGSFVFLGLVVTTLELAPTGAALKKHCGSCTRCIDVCPTRALRGDYTMDATRCIADLTQRKDAIPRALRPLIGDWVWGCDLCQEVCPPTKLARTAAAAEFAPQRDDDAYPSLEALLFLRSGEFERRFKPSAMGWRGGAHLRRNAAVALGNALDRAAVAPLERALAGDPNPLVRGHVAWALGRIGSPRALAALRERLAAEPDESVREELASALASWKL